MRKVITRTFVDKLDLQLMMKAALAYKPYVFQLALRWI